MWCYYYLLITLLKIKLWYSFYLAEQNIQFSRKRLLGRKKHRLYVEGTSVIRRRRRRRRRRRPYNSFNVSILF